MMDARSRNILIVEGRGSHFDPDLVDVLADIGGTFRDIARRFAEHEGREESWPTTNLGHAQGLERLFQLRDRIAVNFPKITLLAFDLPIADPDRVGRIRDDLAILTEGAEARLQAMEVEAQRLAQASGISEAVADLSQALGGIEQMQAANRVRAMEISANYLDQLSNAFVHQGLGEEQEAELAAMAQGVSASLDSLMDEGRFVGDLLRETTAHLSRLVEA